ncbi:hypothetical protein ACIPLR_09420 [Herbaspirillum huttiense]|uniref:hypothetical protein n=1 Tax=Herbaspirillum huttiense TaxID=863372 RepID=UPI00380A0C32
MNKTIEALLAEVEENLSRQRIQNAQELLKIILQQCSQVDLRRLHDPVLEIIDRFLPKRRRDLKEIFKIRLGINEDVIPQPPASAPGKASKNFATSLDERFDELRDWRIFQWSTYYKDELRSLTAETVQLLRTPIDPDEIFNLIGSVISRHAKEIFTHGFDYVMSQRGSTKDAAMVKSLGGVRSFLELPVEIYADESSRITEPKDCRTLRRITSRMLSGILTGFLDANFGGVDPVELLCRTAKTWIQILPLVELDDLEKINEKISLDSIAPLLGRPLRLLAQELDHASKMSSIDAIVITSVIVNINDELLEVTLRPPADSSDTKPLELAILSGDGPSVKFLIEQRVKRGYIACVTPKSANFYWRGSFPTREVKEILVEMPEENNGLGFLLTRLRLRFYENKIVLKTGVPLRTNIAERFPLESPKLLTFFRVERPSIRALHTTLSTRTGVLLWCSVRRSGKTIGVSELADGIAGRRAVFQRCELTGGEKASRMLFEQVSDKLEKMEPLPREFLRDVIANAAPMGLHQDRGSILIVDEYDRLFGLLRVFGRRNEDARQLIIQPLLDQFVEFATENLLILLGQQPNAHYIFMDQNQLSAYVQQEPYPLFSHEMTSHESEFHELVRRTFQNTLQFDTTFVDAIYEETGGHPFLAINLLRDFVDWLIARKVIPNLTTLTRELFLEYSAIGLTTTAIGKSRHYQYFKEAASEALSEDGITQGPWIYAAYKLLRQLAINSVSHQTLMNQSEIEEFVASTLLHAKLSSYTTHSFLASAAESNFIEFSEEQIKAKIPLLARISASVGSVA